MDVARRPIATGLALAALAGALVAHAWRFDFVTDDAYISFRYAENLVRHGALEFNLGERVEGYSNFLWTVLLAGGIAAGVEPALAARVLGAACGAAGLVLAWWLARRRAGAAALVAPALLAVLPAYACWSSGGLETSLFTALGLAALALLLAGREAAAGVAYAAAALARPEGALLFGLAALADLAVTRRPRPRLYLAFAAPFCAFLAWRLAYYGEPVPNTFYVKAPAGAATWRRGARYLASFVTENRLWALLPLALFFRARDRRLWAIAGVTVPVYALYVASVGGDFMALHRFLVPLAPLVALLCAEAIAERRALTWAAPALVALAVVNADRIERATLDHVGARDGIDSIGYLRRFAEDRLAVGRWLRAHLPPDTLVSVGGAGALPYASRLPTLDAFGLSDRYVARRVPPGGDRPGHQKIAPLSYLLRRDVDLVCFPPYPELARHGYRRRCFPVEVDPRTVPGGRYCCWEKRR